MHGIKILSVLVVTCLLSLIAGCGTLLDNIGKSPEEKAIRECLALAADPSNNIEKYCNLKYASEVEKTDIADNTSKYIAVIKKNNDDFFRKYRNPKITVSNIKHGNTLGTRDYLTATITMETPDNTVTDDVCFEYKDGKARMMPAKIISCLKTNMITDMPGVSAACNFAKTIDGGAYCYLFLKSNGRSYSLGWGDGSEITLKTSEGEFEQAAISEEVQQLRGKISRQPIELFLQYKNVKMISFPSKLVLRNCYPLMEDGLPNPADKPHTYQFITVGSFIDI